VPRDHPQLPTKVWAVEEDLEAPGLTIRAWHERYRTDRDQRTSDRWPLVFAAADRGVIDRADIVAVYEESGSDAAAADKAIGRWVKAGRLLRKGTGVYELVS
jgi:hypothetical protein